MASFTSSFGLKIQNVPAGVIGFDLEPSVGLLARDVDKLGMDIRSFREPLGRAIRQVMIPSFRKNFDVGGRPPWEPLAEYTIKRREDAGIPSTSPLVKTGKLRRRATQINIWTVTPTFAAVKSLPQDVWYGYLQQSGYGSFQGKLTDALGQASDQATAKKTYIPQRQFIMIQDEDVADIEDVFATWLDERMLLTVGRRR